MQSKLFRITINTTQPDLLLRFYGFLGFQFAQKSVDKGSQAWLGRLGDLALEIFSIKESYSSRAPGVQLSFQVASIADILKQLSQIKAEVMLEPMETKTGLMAIVMDPDGRSIELHQT